MDRLRVIQWTTGKVGKLSTRGILDDPRLELVGVYAHSDDKAGTDAGTLCGRPETGVQATTDIDALIALGADTVIYTPFMADVEHAVRLLESGLDVISTNLFLNVGGIQGDTKQRLADACRRGDSSLYVTGVNPGWINTITAAMTMTAVCRGVEMVSVAESANVSVYESAETWRALGFGLPHATPEVIEMAQMWLSTFHDSVQRMAVALHHTLDDMEFFIEYATAAETVDLGWLRLNKDTIAAVRAGWNGKANGNTVVQSNVAWYLTKHLNEHLEFDDDHYHVVIKGEPEVQTRIRFIPPETWGNHEWDTMTAMPAVNAAVDVAAAPPGILTLHDVGLASAPAGIWLNERA
ncbi:dihydrodipicolinate reductase (plasmid) [Mycolicibacterium madagascariense]|uniref:Dihydrodipicolinate reductase n=2 Tax=Mycolicibacterium madagascariense TaxID=212765 RepID=A0A7I7XPX8_9MYCO|nr:dihydrodipicolinate reductase [Mycolicibacterium madagascariense]